MADKVSRKKIIENFKNGINTKGYLVFHNKENDTFIIRKERNESKKKDSSESKPDGGSKDDVGKNKLSKVL